MSTFEQVKGTRIQKQELMKPVMSLTCSCSHALSGQISEPSCLTRIWMCQQCNSKRAIAYRWVSLRGFGHKACSPVLTWRWSDLYLNTWHWQSHHEVDGGLRSPFILFRSLPSCCAGLDSTLKTNFLDSVLPDVLPKSPHSVRVSWRRDDHDTGSGEGATCSVSCTLTY